MAGDRGALQLDLFGEQSGSETLAAVASPPMMTASGWQLPETAVFVDALKRGALGDSIAVIRRLKVDAAWKVLLEAGFTVGFGKTHAALLGPLQKDLMEAAQRQMSGRELKDAREAELRAGGEKAAALENSTANEPVVAPPAKAVQSEQTIEIRPEYLAVAERFGIPARSVAEIAQLSAEMLIARDQASGRLLPNAMSPATIEPLPLGSVRLAAIGGEMDNRYVDYLREFDAQTLVTAEAEQGIKQHPTYARYLDWAKRGMEIPPISVYEVGPGVLQSTNRRRTLVAQELGLTVKGWFGVVNKETGLPLKYGDVRSAIHEIERQKTPDAPQKTTERQTDDAGAELTYNRRNRIKRGLVWSDLEGLETALRVREVVKAKVYPRPDYQGLIDSGVAPLHAYLVKQVYDSLAAKPAVTNPTDAQLQAYITGVNRVMAGALSWVRDPKGAAMWDGLRRTESRMLDHVYPDGWKTLHGETSLLGRRYFPALQPGYAEFKRAKLAVDDGWPNAQEAWQKQGFSVGLIEDVTPHYYGGNERDGTPYVTAYLATENGKMRLGEVRVSGAQDQHDPAVVMQVAARSAELVNRFALINKRGHLVSVHDNETAAIEAARESVRRGGEAGISDTGISVEVAQRKGAARRVNGENVSSEQVLETFGFRGINFGNWMKGKGNETERQLHLNHIYDAFLDLAEILGLPPKAMSLDGMLGIAVGAQGGGQNLAHFVPGVNEINLTRTSGAGALAHEWAHAMDHYFARLAGLDRSEVPFLSAHAGLPPTVSRMVQIDGKWQRSEESRFAEGLRPEMRAQFNTVVEAMTKRPITDGELAAQRVASLERTNKNVASWLKAIRRDFESNRVQAVLVSYKGESISALEAFDDLARRVVALDLGGDPVPVSRNKAVSPVVAEIRDLYKAATGRLYPLDNAMGLQSNLDSLRYQASDKDEPQVHAPQKVSTEFAKAAAKLDSGKQKQYWSTSLEMFARSFDVFVSEKLEARAAMNSYLSHTGRADETTPTGDERRVVVAAIENLVSEVRTRETEKGGVALFSFGGSRAQDSDQRLLADAQQRLAAGEDAELVRQNTGWFKGVDEKWRFEINDSDAKLKKPFPKNGAAFGDVFKGVYEANAKAGKFGLTVGDVLHHPALFSAYPDIAKIPLTTQKKDGASYLGANATGPAEIAIGVNTPMYEVVSVLLHEIQHGIQAIEGFAKGGNSQTAAIDPASYNIEVKQAADLLKNATLAADGKLGELAQRYWSDGLRGKEMFEYERLSKELVEYRTFEETRQRYQEQGSPYEIYRRLSGEVEARNVQTRMKLSGDERRAISPEATADVPKKDVIVMFNGQMMHFAPMPANAVGEARAPSVRQPHSVASLSAAIDGAFSGTKDFARLLTATGRFEIIEAKDIPVGLTGARFSAASLAVRDRGNIETAGRRMGRFVDAFVAGQVKDQDTQLLGDTPTVLQALGAKELSLHIDGATVRKMLAGKHKPFLSADMLKQIPESLYDPLMVFNSPDENGRPGKLMITKVIDRVGNPVVAAVLLSKATNGRYVVNDVASAYGLENSGPRLMGRADKLEYVRNEKSLGLSSIPNLKGESMVGVVQKARSLGVNVLTEVDVVNQFGAKYSVAAEQSPFVGKEIARTPMDKERKTLLVDGVERPAQNSSGQPIHWSEEGTRNFADWFDSSKMIDADGRPMLMYHGRTNDFAKFKDGRHGMFTSDHLAASDYAHGNGGNVMPVYLSIKNPASWKTAEELGFDKERLKAAGYDGAFLRMGDEEEATFAKEMGFDPYPLCYRAAMVVDPSQIKSAIGNRGDFDVDNPDIHYSKDGRILGFVVDGQTKLVADNISREDDDVRGLLMHEIGVHALRLGRSDGEFQQILADFEKLRDSGDSRVVAAFERVPADTAPHLVSEEALGYFVEANPRLPLAARVLSWLKEQVVKIADHLPPVDQSRLGQWARSLSTDDLVYMAATVTRDAVGRLGEGKVTPKEIAGGEGSRGDVAKREAATRELSTRETAVREVPNGETTKGEREPGSCFQGRGR